MDLFRSDLAVRLPQDGTSCVRGIQIYSDLYCTLCSTPRAGAGTQPYVSHSVLSLRPQQKCGFFPFRFNIAEGFEMSAVQFSPSSRWALSITHLGLGKHF